MVSGDRQVTIGERGPFHAMLREFSRHFDRIDVLCPRPAAPVTVTTLYDRVHFHPADCGRAKMSSYVARRGGELIAEHGARLIVSHDYGWFYNGLGSARLSHATGVPYLSEIHHIPGHPVAADWRERFDKRIAKAYVRWATTRAIAFRVVNSAEMPVLLERWGVPREKIVVLPSLYIDLDVFHPTHETGASAGASDESGASEFDQDVVFVGRMVANKGLDRIVDALAGIASRGTPLRALFVGRGPLLKATRARAAALGENVKFVEWVESPADLARIYQRSRVCVCASTCEGGPRFTVEAMACGTPVVSTPVGVMRELLEAGDKGRLCGFDTASLVDALTDVLSDEAARRELGHTASEAARRFEYSRTIRAYADGLYRIAGVERAGKVRAP
jgi:glycosyltransferase involved in cell wall biosynthesis